jgi:curved DNA-binding protein CbpA
MSKRDYYKVLDVPKTATESEIKKAYRRLAMKYSTLTAIRAITPAEESNSRSAKEACEMLSDSHKRAIYDQHGHAGHSRPSSRGRRGGGFGWPMPSATFSATCSGTSSAPCACAAAEAAGRRCFRGADLRYEVELELGQAVFGYTLELELPKLSGMRAPAMAVARPRAASRVRRVTPATDQWPGAYFARLLPATADLSALPWWRHDRQESVRHLPRAGACPDAVRSFR